MKNINFEQTNFQKLLDRKINEIKDNSEPPKLLLHSCCAPCSSYVLEYLSQYFSITIYYYNPNISEKSEYEKRVNEQKRLISELPAEYPISFIEGDYCPEKYFSAVKGMEHFKEGGERCFVCYRLRLSESADIARKYGFDYFTTTLSISPLKNAAKLNEIGAEESERTGIPYLFSDFKKKEGYKRSIVLSAKYGLYRQDYCGCIFSKRARDEMKGENND